jgi:hypothetical protein
VAVDQSAFFEIVPEGSANGSLEGIDVFHHFMRTRSTWDDRYNGWMREWKLKRGGG